LKAPTNNRHIKPMIGILLRILLVAMALWLVRRAVAAFQAPKTSRSGTSAQKTENTMVKDPVCGMYMDARLAIRLDNTNEAIYFCSDECRNKYRVKSPGEKVGSAASER
jgi:YHS domain-containing protein